MERYLVPYIQEDLNEKMVFLGGPRQVGKTTLSYHLLGVDGPEVASYLNWDRPEVRQTLMDGLLPSEKGLIVLDEIHKYKDWRNLVKGFYDQYKMRNQFLVTGSARLDYYRRGGDSLQGRYHFYRLHPICLAELGSDVNQSDLEHLLRFGGFPEPFLKGNTRHWKRWQLERQKRIIYDDLISLEKVREVSNIELLQSLLPDRVGSILSVNSLRQSIGVAFETVDSWITILENLYFCYRIPPYSNDKLRLAKKDKKLYLWDWSLVENKGAQFENMVASLLFKFCHFLQDVNGEKMELSFIRSHDGKEIDFIVRKNKNIIFAVECKTGEREISKNISYFAKQLKIPQFYQVHLGIKDFIHKETQCRILPFLKFHDVLKEEYDYLK